jgi:hypothetical protein
VPADASLLEELGQGAVDEGCVLRVEPAADDVTPYPGDHAEFGVRHPGGLVLLVLRGK